MQGLRGPLAGPLIRPIVGTLTAGIDLVPSIRCFVSERGRAGVVVLVRNQGTVAVPR